MRRGLVYDVQGDYEPLDGDTAHAVFAAECPERDVRAVCDTLIATLDRLAGEGPTPEELATEVNGFRRQFNDRDAQVGYMMATALDHLFGRPFLSPDELLVAREAVAPADAARVLREALPSLLVLAGGDPVDGDRFTRFPEWSTDVLTGREHSPAGIHLRRPRERLIVSPDGVTIVVGPRDVLTVRYDRCTLVEHESPSRRALLGKDGVSLVVDAEHWRGGKSAIDAIDAAVARELVACDEHGLGGLIDPDAQADERRN